MTDPRRRYWLELPPEKQRQVVREMSAMGFGDYQIATATKLSVEQVREILGRRQ